MQDIEEIKDLILKSNKILIISHVSPDSDAYGSQCALGMGLEILNKEVIYYNESGFDSYFQFIPSAKSVTNKISDLDYDAIIYDAIIIVDCGDIKRVGKEIKNKLLNLKNIINIDHHKSNDTFGSLNYVDIEASSTCEMIHNLLTNYLSVKINSDIAKALLSGIYGDTGSLRYSSTSARTLEVVSKLRAICVQFNELMESMYSSTTLSSVKLEAAVFSDIEFILDNKVTCIQVTRSKILEFNACMNDSEGFVEKARDIEGVNAAILIKENEADIKVSLRSKVGTFDVSKIAGIFGGGGHINAAGFNTNLPINDLKNKIFKEFENYKK